MTEEQRMQEGRRMFQIFAARMFEQRVLTAYREKVAAERQQKLLEELAADEDRDAAQAAKKAKDAEKRKAKKQAQKQKQQEEKARKDAELAEKEAAAKAEQERKLEEQRKRREEQRLKKEEQRKAQDAELQRKAAEKLKRQKEEQDRRMEAERKAREQKEIERKAREDAKKKEREERDAREREAKERKAKADQERKERDAKEKEAERLRRETQAVQQAQAVQAAKRAAAPAAVPIPPGLTKQPSNFASPHVQPVVPKAPTPVRPRQGSQQGSKGSSPKTPAALAGHAKAASPGVIGGPSGSSQTQNPPIAPKTILSRPPSQPPLNTMQQQNVSSPMGMIPPPGMPMPQREERGGFSMHPPGLNGYPHGPSSMMPGGNMQRHPMPQNMFSPPPQPIGSDQHPRPFGHPNGMAGGPAPPPGFASPFAGSMQPVPPGFANQTTPATFRGVVDSMPARSQHSRQHSGSSSGVEPLPPIGAPGQGTRLRGLFQGSSSVAPGDQNRPVYNELDGLTNQLGSSALLGDDTPEPDFVDRRPRPGPPHNPVEPPAFPGASNFGSRQNAYPLPTGVFSSNTWGTPSIPYSTPALGGAAGWGGSPTGGWPSSGGFGLGLANPSVPSRPRHAQIRIGMVDAYKTHASSGRIQSDGFVDARSIFTHVQGVVRPPVEAAEMLDLLDTEGTPQNGGGSFQLRQTGDDKLDVLLKWVPDDGQGHGRVGNIGGAGDIGSPVVQPVSANQTPYGSMRGFPGLGQTGGLSGLGQGL